MPGPHERGPSSDVLLQLDRDPAHDGAGPHCGDDGHHRCLVLLDLADVLSRSWLLCVPPGHLEDLHGGVRGDNGDRTGEPLLPHADPEGAILLAPCPLVDVARLIL